MLIQVFLNDFFRVSKVKPASYFKSSGHLLDSQIATDSGYLLDVKTLPPFLRTLLVMDGTVTKSLSAWFWEPVSVKAFYNKLEILTEPLEVLGIKPDDKILRREVSLIGKHTQQTFACARSIVSMRHLPEHIGDSLEKGKMGIGELLQEQDIETYRDIFEINYLTEKEKNKDKLLNSLTGDIVSRSYQIRVNGVSAIIVTEYFPVNLY